MSRKVLFLLLLLPFICSDGLSQSRVYWADAWNPSIHSAYLDGTYAGELTRITLPTGMAIDAQNGWAYYLLYPLGHGAYGELHRIPLSGGTDEKLVDTDWTEGGLAIDSDAGKIYWVTRIGDMNHVTIMRASLDGTDVEIVASDVSDNCSSLALDPVGRHLFMLAEGSILKLGIDTGIIEDIGPNPQLPPYPSFDGEISIDPLGRKVYWTRRGNSSSSGPIGIFRTDLDGSNLELLWDEVYADAGDIVVDGVNKYVYWTQWSGFSATNGILIRRAPIDQPITWYNIEDIVRPPDTPSGLTRGLGIFIDPGPPVLASPAREAQNVSSTTELRWQSVQCSPRYDVQVAADPDFASIVYRTNTPRRATTFVAPVAPHRYWWRVHSNACGIASHWSEARWFDVGVSGPLAPTLNVPEDGAQTGRTVTFSWTPAADADYQTFQLSIDSDFSPTQVDADSLAAAVASYEVSNLIPGQCYYWRVAGFDTDGRYTFTTPGLFSVMDVAGGVTLLEPADGAGGVSTYPDFSWTAADGADKYRFQLSWVYDFAAFEIDTVVESTSLRLATPLGYTMTYSWRVCAVNLAGDGPWTDASFTVALGTGTEGSTELPTVTRLRTVYPNPTSAVVHIPFELAGAGEALVRVFDLFGRHVKTVLNEQLSAGRYDRTTDVRALASGTYVAVLEAGGVRERRVFTVVR